LKKNSLLFLPTVPWLKTKFECCNSRMVHFCSRIARLSWMSFPCVRLLCLSIVYFLFRKKSARRPLLSQRRSHQARGQVFSGGGKKHMHRSSTTVLKSQALKLSGERRTCFFSGFMQNDFAFCVVGQKTQKRQTQTAFCSAEFLGYLVLRTNSLI